jgi:hypothetical protein
MTVSLKILEIEIYTHIYVHIYPLIAGTWIYGHVYNIFIPARIKLRLVFTDINSHSNEQICTLYSFYQQPRRQNVPVALSLVRGDAEASGDGAADEPRRIGNYWMGRLCCCAVQCASSRRLQRINCLPYERRQPKTPVVFDEVN